MRNHRRINHGGHRGYFQKLSQSFEISEMTFKWLGKKFEGDSADMYAGKLPMVAMGGQAEGLACNYGSETDDDFESYADLD
jgi:hypothetical protein